MELLPSENKIVGSWVKQGKEVISDEACNRIKWLIKNSFSEIAILNWQAIYKDNSDGRYWLLDYPQSHLHGGGPPSIKCISNETVNKMNKFKNCRLRLGRR